MKIKTLFKTIFCAGLVLTLVLYLCHLYGNYIEKTQEPITGYTYNGFEEKSNYKSSNIILITSSGHSVVELPSLSIVNSIYLLFPSSFKRLDFIFISINDGSFPFVKFFRKLLFSNCKYFNS